MNNENDGNEKKRNSDDFDELDFDKLLEVNRAKSMKSSNPNPPNSPNPNTSGVQNKSNVERKNTTAERKNPNTTGERRNTTSERKNTTSERKSSNTTGELNRTGERTRERTGANPKNLVARNQIENVPQQNRQINPPARTANRQLQSQVNQVNRVNQVKSDKNIVADAKVRTGFQEERAEIFNKLEKDEEYRNRYKTDKTTTAKTPKTDENDGSYRYAGRDIKSNRQKFVDVQPKSKAPPDFDSVNSAKDVTVKTKKRQKRQKRSADSEEYTEKSGFYLSGAMKAILYIVAVIAVSIIIALNIINIANDVFAFVKPYYETEVTIPENAELSDVIEALMESELIKYPRIFDFYIGTLRKRGDDFVAGKYLLNTTMNYDDYISAIRRKTNAYASFRLTIPEGFTVDEIIDMFLAQGIGTRETFVDVINNYEFSYSFVKLLDETELSPNRKYRLEGYLFPDTYDFYVNSTEVQVIDRLLKNFDAKFTEEFYLNCEMIGMTVDDVINLASIVEREARSYDDFPRVSSVFHNRLVNSSNFPRLESNATVQYSLGVHDSDLLWMTEQDMNLDLPYNTYVYSGLPPSAICNPGYEAIYAALEPELTEYYYFVSTNSGTILYAKTYNEHLNNIVIARSEPVDSGEPPIEEE